MIIVRPMVPYTATNNHRAHTAHLVAQLILPIAITILILHITISILQFHILMYNASVTDHVIIQPYPT